jgi:hypothetical protein
MVLQYISIPIFLISFAIGIFFVYIVGTEGQTVLIYPTPTNTDIYQYKDKADQCFEFKAQEVECPFNLFSVKTVPVQSN